MAGHVDGETAALIFWNSGDQVGLSQSSSTSAPDEPPMEPMTDDDIPF